MVFLSLKCLCMMGRIAEDFFFGHWTFGTESDGREFYLPVGMHTGEAREDAMSRIKNEKARGGIVMRA